MLDCKPFQAGSSVPAGIDRREATNRRDIFGSLVDLETDPTVGTRMAMGLLKVRWLW